MNQKANNVKLPGFTAEAALSLSQGYQESYSERFAKAPEVGGVVHPMGLGWFTACYMVTFGHPGCLLTLLIPE